jgi:hypothetical protein
MPQGVLNFSVEGTKESLTSNAGTILFGEYLKATRIDLLCNAHLPLPRSNRGYTPFEHIQPLLLMLHSGGRVLDDVRMIHRDKAMKEILNIKRLPISESVGKWIARHGLQGVYGIESMNRVLTQRHLKGILEPLVLDIDASVILSQKSTAATTYKKQSGYTPIIGHINGGFVIHSEFRSGNIAPADHNLTFVQRCEEQLPPTRKLDYLRADSASYQAELFDYCQNHHITYTIGAHLDRSVYAHIQEITEWKPFKTKQGTTHHLKEEVGEFLHTMHHSEHAFRMIVVKKTVTPMLPNMWNMLSINEKIELAREHYHVIATNADESMSAEEVVAFYRQRGDASENQIKELKNGFNLSYLPSSDFIANAFYFQIGVLAYNLFMLFKQTLQNSWQKHTVATLRYKLYRIAGKAVKHSRRIILKVPEEFVDIFRAIRERIHAVSLE